MTLLNMQMRLNKVSELIHNSTNHQNLDSAGVSVHFQEIIDLVYCLYLHFLSITLYFPCDKVVSGCILLLLLDCRMMRLMKLSLEATL